MYEVFDNFLETETWYKTHPNDEERFYVALNKILRQENFNPDKMGEYMFQKLSLNDADDTDDLVKAVRRLTRNAWAVYEFFDYNNI